MEHPLAATTLPMAVAWQASVRRRRRRCRRRRRRRRRRRLRLDRTDRRCCSGGNCPSHRPTSSLSSSGSHCVTGAIDVCVALARIGSSRRNYRPSWARHRRRGRPSPHGILLLRSITAHDVRIAAFRSGKAEVTEHAIGPSIPRIERSRARFRHSSEGAVPAGAVASFDQPHHARVVEANVRGRGSVRSRLRTTPGPRACGRERRG